jgi:hypothetical protein
MSEAINEKDYRTRAKRPASYPYKMLASFADAKKQHPAHPELAYVWFDNARLVASDGFRLLSVKLPGTHFVLPQIKLLPLEFFSKVKPKDDVPALMREFFGLTSYQLPESCDPARYPDWHALLALPPVCRFRAHRMRFLDRIDLVERGDDGSGIDLRFRPESLLLESRTGDQRTPAELGIMPSRDLYAHPMPEARFNPAYMKAALDAILTEYVTVSVVHVPKGPYFMILESEDPDFQVKATVALAVPETEITT